MTLPVKIKKLLEPLGFKFWSEAQRAKMKPVIDFMLKQESTIKKLEDDVRSLSQPDMFVDKYKGRSTTFPDMEPVEYSLNAHCKVLLDTFGLDDSKVQTFMQRKGLSTEEFLANAAKGDKK